MTKFGTSQNVPRKEDIRFLTGTGRYMDDLIPEGALHAVFLRSTVAHGNLSTVDTSAAKDLPGVVAVYTAPDLAGHLVNAMDYSLVRNRDGSRGAAPVRPMLATDRLRYVGEAIAMVVAETRAAALDAAEAITFETDDLPVHTALATGGPTIHAEAPDNLGYDWAFGDEHEVARIFETAAHTTRLELVEKLSLDRDAVRVTTPDVGGGFGI